MLRNESFIRRLKRAALNGLWFVMGVYGAITAGWLALKTLGITTWSPVELVNSLSPLLLLPVLVLFPISLLFRRRPLALITAPAMLAFLIGYGRMFIPHPVHAATQATDFRLLTYNLHAEPAHLQPMLDVIRDA